MELAIQRQLPLGIALEAVYSALHGSHLPVSRSIETPDYALVVRFRNPSTDSLIVVLAGLQRFGTDAASQFAISHDLLAEFNRQVGWNWRNKNVEVVLRVDVVNGRAGAPIVEAFHVW